MALRATQTAGGGQSSGVTSLGITIPSSGVGGTVIAGDVATLQVLMSQAGTTTLTTPSGWSVSSGPDVASSAGARSYLLNKTLASGDIGTTLTLTFSAFTRVTATLEIESGVTTTGQVVGTPAVDATVSDGTPPVPTVASVPAGSTVLCFMGRATTSGATSPTVGLPSGFTTAASNVSTGYSATGNTTTASGRLDAASAGSYGGGSGTSSPNTAGIDYTIAYPPAQLDNTQQVPSAAVGAAAGAASPSVAPDVPSAYVPVRTQDVSVSADTALAVPSAVAGAFADPAAPGTAVPVLSAFVGAEADPGSLTISSSPAVPTAFVPVRLQDAAVTASSVQTVPTAFVGSASAAPGIFELYRMQVWTGSAWKKITPLVWDGTNWVAIPVTVTPSVS